MTSPTWQSRLKSTSAISMPREQALCCVSPGLCLHAPLSVLRLSAMYLGKWVRYAQGGKGLQVMGYIPLMSKDIHSRERGDDTSLGAALELALL